MARRDPDTVREESEERIERVIEARSILEGLLPPSTETKRALKALHDEEQRLRIFILENSLPIDYKP